MGNFSFLLLLASISESHLQSLSDIDENLSTTFIPSRKSTYIVHQITRLKVSKRLQIISLDGNGELCIIGKMNRMKSRVFEMERISKRKGSFLKCECRQMQLLNYRTIFCILLCDNQSSLLCRGART